MQGKNEIWLETTHGRRGKCKSQFKAVFNKVLISGLVLATFVSTGAMAAPAYAVEVNPRAGTTMEYGMSVEQATQNIKNTIDYIKANLKNGSLVDSALIDLSNQLYSLDSAIQANGGTVSQDVKTLLGDVEVTLAKVSSKNAGQAKIALAVVMSNLGVDGTTANQAQADASSSTIKFTDVPDNKWYTDGIYACAKKGLVSGVGDNKFNPFDTMTRCEFLTVVVRYLYQDAIKTYDGPTTEWWTMYYNIALQKGLIKSSEFSKADMKVGMSRQEMALVISRALAELGQSPDKVVSSSKIADYTTIGSYYQDAVKVTYTAGIISGTDSKGTFNPMGTLNRAEACTVLNRLTEPGTRSPKQGTEDNNSDSFSGHSNDDGTITIGSGGYGHNSNYDDHRFDQSATHQEWVEGQKHNDPQVGDVVIKADGTRVTLEATNINGTMILGWGANGPQGVDPYTGVVGENGTVRVGSSAWWDSSQLIKDPASGSVFSRREWQEIRDYAKPTTPGTYEGQKGGLYDWYEWDTFLEEWCWYGPKI